MEEALFPSLSAHPVWPAPTTGRDNTPTVSWTFKEAATINPVVADLLRICSTINRLASITPSVFYHPGHLNTMADDASRRFDLSPDQILLLFSRKYHSSQSPSSWTQCHPPSAVISSVISALRKLPSEEVTFPMPAPINSTPNGPPSAPSSMWTTNCKSLTSQPSNYFRCMDTGSKTVTTPPRTNSGRTRLQWRGVLSPRSTFWRASTIPASPRVLPARTYISTSPACSITTPTKTPLPRAKKQSLWFWLLASLLMSTAPNTPPAPQTSSSSPSSSASDPASIQRPHRIAVPHSSAFGTSSSTTRTGSSQETPPTTFSWLLPP